MPLWKNMKQRYWKGTRNTCDPRREKRRPQPVPSRASSCIVSLDGQDKEGCSMSGTYLHSRVIVFDCT